MKAICKPRFKFSTNIKTKTCLLINNYPSQYIGLILLIYTDVSILSPGHLPKVTYHFCVWTPFVPVIKLWVKPHTSFVVCFFSPIQFSHFYSPLLSFFFLLVCFAHTFHFRHELILIPTVCRQKETPFSPVG